MSFFGILLSIVLIAFFGILSVKLIIGFIRDIKNKNKVVLDNKVEISDGIDGDEPKI